MKRNIIRRTVIVSLGVLLVLGAAASQVIVVND